VVESSFDRATLASAPATPAAALTGGVVALRVVVAVIAVVLILAVLVLFLILVVGRKRCGLDLGFDLIAEIGLGVRLGVGGEAVAASEVTELRGGNLELMGDPCVRAALADPGADLIQLCS
jgi:hypothetical protein